MPILTLLIAAIASVALVIVFWAIAKWLQRTIFFRQYDESDVATRAIRELRGDERLLNRYFSFVEGWVRPNAEPQDTVRLDRARLLRQPLVDIDLDRRRRIALWVDAGWAASSLLVGALVFATVARLLA
jgi:hypothetical protein